MLVLDCCSRAYYSSTACSTPVQYFLLSTIFFTTYSTVCSNTTVQRSTPTTVPHDMYVLVTVHTVFSTFSSTACSYRSMCTACSTYNSACSTYSTHRIFYLQRRQCVLLRVNALLTVYSTYQVHHVLVIILEQNVFCHFYRTTCSWPVGVCLSGLQAVVGCNFSQQHAVGYEVRYRAHQARNIRRSEYLVPGRVLTLQGKHASHVGTQ